MLKNVIGQNLEWNIKIKTEGSIPFDYLEKGQTFDSNKCFLPSN